MNNAIWFVVATAAALALSLIFNRKKTLLGVKKGLKMLLNMLLALLNVLAIVSVAFFLIPESLILNVHSAERTLRKKTQSASR